MNFWLRWMTAQFVVAGVVYLVYRLLGLVK